MRSTPAHDFRTRTGVPPPWVHFLRPTVAAVWLSMMNVGVAAGQGLPAARPDDIGLSSLALGRIAPALQAYVDSGKVAGIVAVVARHGKVGYAQAVGQMDVERRVPMRTDGIFRIYSMTKPVIARGGVWADSGSVPRRGDLHPASHGRDCVPCPP